MQVCHPSQVEGDQGNPPALHIRTIPLPSPCQTDQRKQRCAGWLNRVTNDSKQVLFSDATSVCPLRRDRTHAGSCRRIAVAFRPRARARPHGSGIGCLLKSWKPQGHTCRILLPPAGSLLTDVHAVASCFESVTKLTCVIFKANPA